MLIADRRKICQILGEKAEAFTTLSSINHDNGETRGERLIATVNDCFGT